MVCALPEGVGLLPFQRRILSARFLPMGARLWWIGVRSEQTKWRIGALKRCETDGRKCQSAPMARIRRCERRGRYLVIATLAPIYLGLVRRRLSRGRTHLRSSKLSTAGGDTLNKSSRRCAPGSGASSGRWHLPSIEHTTTDDKCRAFLCSPMRAAPHHPRDFVQRVLGREESWIIEIESETGEKRCIQKYFSLAVVLNAVVATAFLCEGLSSRSPPK